MNAGRCFALTVGALILFTVARAFGLLGPNALSVSLLTAALVLIAWSSGAIRADLGLGRADMSTGLRYGAGACGVVLLALLLAAAVPATDGFLHDARPQITGGRLLYQLGVSIVLLTAVPEEFAFRGVLLGSALRLWSPWRASLITSALLGRWHIAPALHTVSGNRVFRGEAASVAGQVLLVFGSIAGDVRRRPGLVLAQAAVQEPDRPGDGPRRDQRRRAHRRVVRGPTTCRTGSESATGMPGLTRRRRAVTSRPRGSS